MGGVPESDARRNAQRGRLADGLVGLSLAVFAAGTLRAIYLVLLGEGVDRVASVGRLAAVALAAGVVLLWRLSRPA